MKKILVISFSLLLFFSCNNGDKCLSGDCENGKGIYAYSNGDRYDGEFTFGKKHGNGTYVWKDGSKYDGEWKIDKENGYGTYTSISGEISKGLFKNGEFIGESNDRNHINSSEKNIKQTVNKSGYVNVQNLNFRKTPEIKEDNIIGKLQKGQWVTVLNVIKLDVEVKQGLLKKETIVQYKGKDIKLQPNKSIEIINTSNNNYSKETSYTCKAVINENENIIFHIDGDDVEVISTEDWVYIQTIEGLNGYVYSRFVTID